VGLNALKSLNLTNGYPSNNKNKNKKNNNNKVKLNPSSSRVKITNESKVVQKYIYFFWGGARRSARQCIRLSDPNPHMLDRENILRPKSKS
jgi:hypothetical protein